MNSQKSSPELQLEISNSLALSLLYGPALTSAHDYWKNHIFDYLTWLHSTYAMTLKAKKRKSVALSTFSPSICREVMGPDAMMLVY